MSVFALDNKYMNIKYKLYFSIPFDVSTLLDFGLCYEKPISITNKLASHIAQTLI